MQVPVQISFHGVDHSDAVEERIREKVAKLEQFFEHMTSCRVVVETHHKNTANTHKRGEPYHIRIDVTVPGSEIVIKREPKDPHAHEDIYVAIRDAFQTAERRVRDYASRMKEHQAPSGTEQPIG